MPQLQREPTHKVVQDYYESLAQFAKLGIKHEGVVRSAFQTLLESCGRLFEVKLVPECCSKGKAAAQVQVDGTILENQGPKPQRGSIIKPKVALLRGPAALPGFAPRESPLP